MSCGFENMFGKDFRVFLKGCYFDMVRSFVNILY